MLFRSLISLVEVILMLMPAENRASNILQANNAGVACKMFEALFSAGININMISTSEIKVSVLVDERDADRAVQAIHDRFFSEFGNA